jgi:Protein of unknown function (DUF3738)
MDRTGIAGHFDFELDVAETDETADNFGALSEALACQFAVKLSRARADLEVLVIDRMGRAPTANWGEASRTLAPPPRSPATSVTRSRSSCHCPESRWSSGGPVPQISQQYSMITIPNGRIGVE